MEEIMHKDNNWDRMTEANMVEGRSKKVIRG